MPEKNSINITPSTKSKAKKYLFIGAVVVTAAYIIKLREHDSWLKAMWNEQNELIGSLQDHIKTLTEK